MARHIGSDPKQNTVCFAIISNVLPSERGGAADSPGFYEAVLAKKAAPFGQLLDRLEYSQAMSAEMASERLESKEYSGGCFLEYASQLTFFNGEQFWCRSSAIGNCLISWFFRVWSKQDIAILDYMYFVHTHTQGMDSSKMCHLVAVPLPLRSLINPMMNFCKLLSSREPYSLLFTVVLTEEWFGYIGSEPKPDNIKFATIPNVVEFKDTCDPFSFIHAITTKMEAPFEELLDALHPQVNAIIADVELGWPIEIGNRRNIAVAVSNTTSASFFSMTYHYALFTKNRPVPVDFLSNSDDQTSIIPGISSTQLADVQAVIEGTDKNFMQIFLKSFSKVSEAQYLVFTSVHELEVEAFNSLKASFPFPVLSIGPAIPYMELEQNGCGTCRNTIYDTEHKKWLDCQPVGSVLYIAFGSASSISSSQMEEIIEALNHNGFRYFWVAREEAPILREKCSERGLIVSWCDQLKVLSHSAICGFWSHCGWNSTLEAVFAGVPLLTFPLVLDQGHNSRKIVDEWKTGWRVRNQELAKDLVGREHISELVKRFMDAESLEVQEMRKKAKELKNICQQAIKKGGSSEINLDAFIASMLGSGFTACP